MNAYFEEIYLMLTEPLYFLQTVFENKGWTEFFSTLLCSIAIAISMFYLSPPFYTGFLGVIFFYTVLNFSFLRLINFFLIILLNWNLENQPKSGAYKLQSYSLMLTDLETRQKSGDYKLLLKISNQMLIIFILSIPLSILSYKLELIKFSGILFTFLPLICIYQIYFLIFASEIYGVSKFSLFFKILGIYFFIYTIPFSLGIFILMQMGMMI